MNLQFLLGVLALLLVSVVADSVSTDIFYWPVGAPQPSVLARVAYDPASLESSLVSYHPPSTPQDGLVRVGLYVPTPTNGKQWTGSLVSGALLTGTGDKNQPTFRLHLGPRNDVYHVSLAAPSTTVSTSEGAGPLVELVSSDAGPQPHLNRPVVVRPDGEGEEEVEEKTMLQK